MRDLSLRVVLVVAAVALVAAFLGALALVTSQNGGPTANGELQIYGSR